MTLPVPGVVAALIGVPALMVAGALSPDLAGNSFIFWCIGDTLGMIFFATLLLVWAVEDDRRYTRSDIINSALLYGLLLIVSITVLTQLVLPVEWDVRIQATTLFVAIWIAFKYGNRGAVLAIAIITIVGYNGAVLGQGPFAVKDSTYTLLHIQVYITVVTVTLLTISMSIEAFRKAEAELQSANKVLESEKERIEKAVGPPA